MNIHSPIIKRTRSADWSEAELDLLRQLWEGKAPIKQIARRLPNRTLSAVRTKTASLGLPPRRSGDKRYYEGVPVSKELADKIAQNSNRLGITKAEYIRRACERCPLETMAE